MKKVATKWKERAKEDRANREQIRQNQIKILEDMTREMFIKAIDALEAQMKYDVSVSKKLGEVFQNAHTVNLLPDNHILHNILLELLQEAMNDNVIAPLVETSWIEHYMYELDFGKENYRLKVYDKNKKEIRMSNASELYDALMSGV